MGIEPIKWRHTPLLPQVYDESMSYMELLYAMLYKLNQVIQFVNSDEDWSAIAQLQTQLNTLVTRVDALSGEISGYDAEISQLNEAVDNVATSILAHANRLALIDTTIGNNTSGNVALYRSIEQTKTDLILLTRRVRALELGGSGGGVDPAIEQRLTAIENIVSGEIMGNYSLLQKLTVLQGKVDAIEKAGGWSTEAVDTLENLLHNITYVDETTGQQLADTLIELLRSSRSIIGIRAVDKFPERYRFVGDSVDRSEFDVYAMYSDNTSEIISVYNVNPDVYDASGKITFVYRDFDASITVPVSVDTVVDWSIVTWNPMQMEIGSNVADTLNELKYKLIYQSGTETIEDDMNNLSFSPATITGLQNTIYVSVNGTLLQPKPILIVGTSAPTYSVSYSAENANVSVYNGSTRVESGSYVAEGTSLTVNAVADSGYRISSVKLNGAEITVPHTWTVNANATIVVSTELAPSTEVTYTGNFKRGGTTTGAVSISGQGTFTDTPSFIKIMCDIENPGSKLKYALIKREGDTWYVQDAKFGTGSVSINVGVDTAEVVFAENYSEVTVSKIQGTVVGTYKPDGMSMVSTQYYNITVANHELEV